MRRLGAWRPRAQFDELLQIIKRSLAAESASRSAGSAGWLGFVKCSFNLTVQLPSLPTPGPAGTPIAAPRRRATLGQKALWLIAFYSLDQLLARERSDGVEGPAAHPYS